jgi:hypothetical protein
LFLLDNIQLLLIFRDGLFISKKGFYTAVSVWDVVLDDCSEILILDPCGMGADPCGTGCKAYGGF